jgi:hypothetical protein
MKTSLNEIEQIEKYLSGKMATEDGLVMEAGLILNPVLRQNIGLQRKLLRLIRTFGRGYTRNEVKQIQKTLFSDPQKKTFQATVAKIFSTQ